MSVVQSDLSQVSGVSEGHSLMLANFSYRGSRRVQIDSEQAISGGVTYSKRLVVFEGFITMKTWSLCV